jgi:flavin reductase (DIM6/NTAB) family NADH-FMN oxidoreductase RutF
MNMHDLFDTIKPEEIQENIFKLIGNDWMLVCAGTAIHYNMMTASWGAAGILWRKPIAIAFIRPQRYTTLFLEENPGYTLNFFDEKHRDIMNLCGSKSGREIDKMNIEGLETLETPSGNLIFKQSKLVLECRKIYYDDIKPEFFLSFDIEKIYAKKDYHRFFIGEIINVWKAK